MKTISAEQFKAQYGDSAFQQFGTQPQQPSYFQRVGQNISSDVNQRIQKVGEIKGRDLNPFLKGYQLFGQGAGLASTAIESPIAELPGIKQGLSLASQAAGQISKVGDTLGGAISKIPGVQGATRKTVTAAVPTIQKATDIYNRPAVKGTVEATGNILRLGTDVAGVAQGAKLATQGAKTAVKSAGELATSVGEKGLQTGKELLTEGKKALTPPEPTAQEAMGQVLQGKTRDIKPGFKAIQNLDTTGVKTYEQLGTKIDETIKNLSKKVDATLDNTKPVKLNQLKLAEKSMGGKIVKTDYVSRAMDNLKELYKSIGDDVSAQNIKELSQKAKAQGLTRLEINNLSRQYGIEFGGKAFSKIGEPLTSVNAQRFENTRKALKAVARQGLGGKEAQTLDESMSSLYRIKELVKNNTEAVNKLAQKIQKRGLLEKLGYHAAKLGNIITGGTLRGVVGGLLPRGVGYKVMNALDLEQSLERNLKIIQKYIQAGDPETMKLLKKAIINNPELMKNPANTP